LLVPHNLRCERGKKAYPDALSVYPDALSVYPDALPVYPDALPVYPDRLAAAETGPLVISTGAKKSPPQRCEAWQGISPRARSCLAGLVEMTGGSASRSKKGRRASPEALKKEERKANGLAERKNWETETTMRNGNILSKKAILLPKLRFEAILIRKCKDLGRMAMLFRRKSAIFAFVS
jgi:hypothetical protein